MQVKVCPKCRAENKPTNAACSICYTSLENVQVTEGSAPAPVRPQAAAPRVKPPSPPAATQQMPAPQQTQMGTMTPPPGMQQAPPGQFVMGPPVRKSSNGIIAVVLTLAVLVFGGAIYFALSQSGLLKGSPIPTDPPDKAVLAFLEAKKTGDIKKVELYLSKNTIDGLDRAFAGAQAKSAGFTRKDAEEMVVWGPPPTAKQLIGNTIAVSLVKGDKEEDDRTKIISVIVDKKEAPAAPQPLLPPGATPPQQPEQEKKVDVESLFSVYPIHVEYVVVAEDGKWKIDLHESSRRELGLGKPGNIFKPGP